MSMHEWQGKLQRFFDACDAYQARLSQKWREHTNRRTILIAVIAGVLATSAYVFIIQPPDSFPVAEPVSVPSDTSLSDIAATLKADGVIRSALVFRMLVTAFGAERSVHAGYYLYKEPEDIFTIARSLSTGAYGLEPERVTIPEGATTRSMAIIFASKLLRFDPNAFLAEAQPQEGYLFPDTYYFLPNATDATVIATMRQNFDTKVASMTPPVASSTHSLADIVIVASIVEKEARTTADRKLIAGVMWNRLKKGMPLQVDAAFLYTLGKGTFQLTKADLQSDSPYNTYTHKGLPPTPIDSPSLDSLEAAANPTPSAYLYYLADNNGVTHYSKTYQQHLIYKAEYLGS